MLDLRQQTGHYIVEQGHLLRIEVIGTRDKQIRDPSENFSARVPIFFCWIAASSSSTRDLWPDPIFCSTAEFQFRRSAERPDCNAVLCGIVDIGDVVSAVEINL